MKIRWLFLCGRPLSRSPSRRLVIRSESIPERRRVEVVEAEPEEEPDDQYQYQGNQLELAPMLREHMILSAPMQPLCSDDCLGLCAQCGKT